MMFKEFTINRYRKTIQEYKGAGYIFTGVGDNTTNPKNIVMVHDVDHDISLCDNLLSVEESTGIVSTYFLRLHAKSYNMLSRNSISIAKRILQNGSNLGLHYEPTFKPSSMDWQEHINTELKILSAVVGQEIEYFNLHEPTRTGTCLSSILPSKNRCYNSPHFEGYKYLSDSSCRWREGCFSEHVGRWNQLLVLTHPIWWYNDCPAENY